MSVLDIRDLRIALNGDEDSQVVKGLNLTIEAGQTMCLVGESGSGKITYRTCHDGALAAGTAHHLRVDQTQRGELLAPSRRACAICAARRCR